MTSKALSWTILIVLSVVWGSSFILMKRGMDAFSSDEVAALRIGMAFLFLSPLFYKYRKIDLKRNFKGLFLMGVFGNLLPAFLFTKAETEISSSLAGMLNALTPIFAVLVAYFWLKIRPSGTKVSGVIVGFLAAVSLMLFDKSANTFQNFKYGILILLATFFYAISMNSIKKYLSQVNSVAATLWAFAITGPLAIGYLFANTQFIEHLKESPLALPSLGYIFILAAGGTALAVILFNVLIKSAGVLFASSCTYLIPIVAILWGLLAGETIHFAQILSMAAIILSVYLINRA